MPVYEFFCQDCSQKFEELILKQSDWDTLACPKCQGRTYRKLMSRFGMSSGNNENGAGSGHSCAGCSSHSCSTCH
jgi:putative FmdB family regulatory protein